MIIWTTATFGLTNKNSSAFLILMLTKRYNCIQIHLQIFNKHINHRHFTFQCKEMSGKQFRETKSSKIRRKSSHSKHKLFKLFKITTNNNNNNFF